MEKNIYKVLLLFLPILTHWACTKEIEPIAASVSPINIKNLDNSSIYKVGSELEFSSAVFNNKKIIWDFGDNSFSSETTPKHIYSRSGTFTVILKAIGDGGSAGVTRTITVLPQLDFTISGGDFEAGTTITTELAPSSNTLGISNLIWSWGDGTPDYTTGVAAKGVHQYAKEGNYTITLSAKFSSNPTPVSMSSKLITIKEVSSRVTKAWSFGGIEEDNANHIVTDLLGNLYVAGYFKGSVKFSDKITYTSKNQTLYVAKYTNTGDLLWIKYFENPSQNEALYPSGLAVGNSGVYISYNNFFNGNTSVKSGILKLNTQTGENLWWKKFTESIYCYSLALDSNEDLYVGGNFYQRFQDGNQYSQGRTGFIMKYKSMSGDKFWGVPRYLSTNVNGFSNIYCIKIGSDNSIFFSGAFDTNIPQNTSITGLIIRSLTSTTSTAGYQTLIGRLDSNGNPLWVKQDGINNSNPEYYSRPTELVLDVNNNIFVLIGLYEGAGLVFDNKSLGLQSTRQNNINYYLMKLKVNGDIDFLKYASESGNASYAMNIDKSGSIITTGWNYISKVSNAGAQIGDEINFLYSNTDAMISFGITSDINNNIFVSGLFKGTITTIKNTTELKSNGDYDCFIIKYGK
ncbi:MAG: PKD domain-containing protein [Arcicella sp.]|nr:PKD domain-containing protein [Arcicella sp.]